MQKIHTNRLMIRELTIDDASFIQQLVNQESWLKYIGNKNINSQQDAEQYLLNGPISMYKQHGFGLWAVELQDNLQTIGICGVIKRDTLPNIDLGFAFLDEFTGYGYAYEACVATLEYTRNQLESSQILAIVTPENSRSLNLLRKLGFTKQGEIQLIPDGEALCLLAHKLI